VPDVILSPHFDDAVLSCWHVLTGPGEVSVINVFAGVPTDLPAPAWWDKYTGATDSADRVQERIDEDRRALALAGRTSTNLDFLDEQYRDREQPLAPITAQIERLLTPGARVLAPAAFADHTDHALVRAAALELRAAGFAVALYADLPHATVQGWPGWVTGKRGTAARDLAAARWDHVLAETDPAAPSVHRLGPDDYARKCKAIEAYATQVKALVDFGGRPLTDPETFGYEVTWATALPAGEASRAAPRR
jgi:hypothetical protein